ncbi:MAG: HPr(Ser) kinase/phosphatase, partial [Deltaproteobacteria bacterium]|nr:HPr(Ser) kinase/phosphatase [Deltaproteobacteria bacterium]
GLTKKILIPQIQKPGLALTGYTSNLHPGRIQVLGNSEIHFLENLPPDKQRTIIKKICKVDIACFVIAHGNQIPPTLIKEASRQKIAILKTSLSTPVFVIRITKFLENKLTELTTIHGVLVDVFGVGVLLLGKSGIGKSECALELVMKGHRLVADDVVMLQKKSPTSIYGSGSDLIKYHMEIRGLGIINIKDLFGVTSVRDQKLVELVIELLEWNPRKEYERLGIDQQYYEIMGVKVPWLQIPVRPGRSMTSVIEVAARNHLLKLKGFYSAREFQTKLTRELLENQVGRGRLKGLVE